MKKSWTLNNNFDADNISVLSKELHISEVLSKLLLQRGVSSYDEAKTFFRPDLSQLHDPFLMKDMDKAVNRLSKAIQNEEKIMVYGDYDVDGTTSVAVLASFLESIGVPAATYIPDRYKEGYGISKQGIDFAEDNDLTLIIALDCGIRAIEKVDYANSLGIDFIICDHHMSGEKIPNACAVLDPNRSDCTYPFKGLSGCGVGFKLIQAYCLQNDLSQDLALEYLDMLTVSIAADIVPMKDENRIIAHFGLKKLSNNPRPAFKALFAKAGNKSSRITISDVVFQLAPRINAAGRMSTGNKAVELLMCASIDEAKVVADEIETNNKDRRVIDENISKEALDIINADPIQKEAWSTVVFNENWHKGVIGIVASRLMDSYYRPTIVLTQHDGLITGSARSISAFDIHKALNDCSELLEKHGGHPMAAGLTMKPENLKAFKEKFESLVRKELNEEDLVPHIHVDSHLGLHEITQSFYKILRQFAPFGPGNRNPVFIAKNITDQHNTKTIGADHSHLKLWIRQQNPKSHPFSGIGFGLGHYYQDFHDKKSFDMAYCIEENEWNGDVKLQLNVKDLRVRE